MVEMVALWRWMIATVTGLFSMIAAYLNLWHRHQSKEAPRAARYS